MSRQGMVAILGRPNVGKSSFFNYVTGKRISIVEDVPGVTRDRIYEEVEWSGRRITLADTGGLEPNTSDTIFRQMKRQAALAIELAAVILFMEDLKDGVTADDMDIATLFRPRTGLEAERSSTRSWPICRSRETRRKKEAASRRRSSESRTPENLPSLIKYWARSV